MDFPAAWINAGMDDIVNMVLEGSLSELLVQTEPKVYNIFVTIGTKVQPILYVQLQKSLYRFLKSVMLFKIRLYEYIELQGSEVNPYDPYLANKPTQGKHLMVTWHVDDLKVSHVKNTVVDGFL